MVTQRVRVRKKASGIRFIHDHDSFRLTGKSRIVKDPNNHAGICFWGNGGCREQFPGRAGWI